MVAMPVLLMAGYRCVVPYSDMTITGFTEMGAFGLRLVAVGQEHGLDITSLSFITREGMKAINKDNRNFGIPGTKS
jgi:hypothetical protein